MPKESQVLSLAAPSCNWNVLMTPGICILTSTWFFADDRVVGLTGALDLISFALSGGESSVDFWIRAYTIGERAKTLNPSVKVSVDTLQSMYPSAPLSMFPGYSILGIQAIGLFSDEELGAYMRECRTVPRNWVPIWTRSSDAGIHAGGMCVRYLSPARPWVSGESATMDG